MRRSLACANAARPDEIDVATTIFDDPDSYPPEAIFPHCRNVIETAEKALLLTENKYTRPEKGWHAVAFFPKLIDIRMLLQQSVFTMHASRNYLEEHKRAGNFLAKLEIPCSMKESLRFMLKDLGFSQKTLFPDLDNLSRDLIRLSKGKQDT